MSRFKILIVAIGIIAAGVYGMPQKFGRSPASAIQLEVASEVGVKRSDFLLAAERTPEAAPEIRLPKQEPRATPEAAAPTSAKTDKTKSPEEGAPKEDSFKKLVLEKVAGNAQWTEFLKFHMLFGKT